MHDSASMSNPGQIRFVLELLDAAASVQRRFDGALANIRGVSFSEYRLLLTLSRQPSESATRVELARLVGLSPSAVTRALKPLEKLGYVRTKRGPRDARQALAKLTENGRILLSDCESVVEDVVRGLELNDEAKERGIALLSALRR